MSRELDRILATIPRLAESERTAFAVVLVSWLGDGTGRDELSPEWIAEIERREEELRSGRAPTIPWEEVEAELDTALTRRRDARRARFDRITVDPDMMDGRACIRGMRLTVARVLEALATLGDIATLRAEYPELEPEDLEQALRFAAAQLDNPIDV